MQNLLFKAHRRQNILIASQFGHPHGVHTMGPKWNHVKKTSNNVMSCIILINLIYIVLMITVFLLCDGK